MTTKREERELLFSVTRKDLRIDTFRAGGNGGQNQNKRDTGVRITHMDLGAVAESRTYRTQGENKKAALYRLVEKPRWKIWHAQRVAEELGRIKDMNEKLDSWMQPKHLKIEVKDEKGRWVGQ